MRARSGYVLASQHVSGRGAPCGPAHLFGSVPRKIQDARDASLHVSGRGAPCGTAHLYGSVPRKIQDERDASLHGSGRGAPCAPAHLFGSVPWKIQDARDASIHLDGRGAPCATAHLLGSVPPKIQDARGASLPDVFQDARDAVRLSLLQLHRKDSSNQENLTKSRSQQILLVFCARGQAKSHEQNPRLI